MTSARSKIPAVMTVDEFIAWPGDGKGGRYQLVDGALRAMSPASAAHSIIQSNLARLIGNHLDVPGNRCRIGTEPAVEVRIRGKHNLRIPDLGVTCMASEPGTVALPDPTLLIEILSPGNADGTWENVWAYTTIPSVNEILIVHSARIFAELLRRQADGSWPEEPEEITGEGMLRLASIEYEVVLKAAYAKTYLLGGENA